VEKGIWEDRIRKDANQEDLGSYYRSQGDIQTMKRRNLPLIQKQKKRSLELYG